MTDFTVPAPVQAVVDAINAGDEDAFVAAFTEDGSVDDWGRVLDGLEGVRSWSQTDAIGQNAQMTVKDATTEGDTTELFFDWRSNRFNGTSRAFVTVAGDKVKVFRIPSHR
ncbi:nuclear transport factor 2 family protein [Pseudoclavibacter helvolus]|uniref:nuclear transport factor 2 family protein n=1 Tax=Pseudoclavibacter helvolus TaxID=255205 RepID=UPI003C76E50F